MTLPTIRSLKSWPWKEALRIATRLKLLQPDAPIDVLNASASESPHVYTPHRPIVLETGFGPSGLPHLGTLGEIQRTTMIARSLERLCPGIPIDLVCFSDDYDGLRRLPTNVPNPSSLEPHIGKPLSRVPDPWGCCTSFAEHNHHQLRLMVECFGFHVRFVSATECYTQGTFNTTLRQMLKHHDAIRDVIVPTLGEARRATYSPFLPLDPDTGVVLEAKILQTLPESDSIVYEHPTSGISVQTSVTNGSCKVQWKPDWAMRWVALNVDYEMHGKDLTDSAQLSAKIARMIGGSSPLTLPYELFLDEEGKKISKSKGNGIDLETWLEVAPPESLSLTLFQRPHEAKRIGLGTVITASDDYLKHAATLKSDSDSGNWSSAVNNPLFHFHASNEQREQAVQEAISVPVSFSLLVNLARATAADTPDALHAFVAKRQAELNKETLRESRLFDAMLKSAVALARIRQPLPQRPPNPQERKAILQLRTQLLSLPSDTPSADIQTLIFAVGREAEFSPLADWFRSLYELLLRQSTGPRLGTFIALLGIKETIERLDAILIRNSSSHLNDSLPPKDADSI